MLNVEYLLNRKCIEINTADVFSQLQNKVILITGAAGSIGSELVQQVLQYNPTQILLFDQAESPLADLANTLKREYHTDILIPIIGSVSNKDNVDTIFKTYHPDMVFHAAAYKHVPMLEKYPCEGVLANVLGTKNIVDACIEYSVERFVFISTDKAVKPSNVMGATKRTCEMYIQQKHQEHKCKTIFNIVRFGNVLGSSGSVIPIFEKQIAEGGPITLTDKNVNRYFMSIPEACTLVLKAVTIGKGGEVFVFDMGEPIKIYDLAVRMIELAGLKPNEDIQINVTGMRPGEKIYEELFSVYDVLQDTGESKIKIAKQLPITEDIDELVDALIAMAKVGDKINTVMLLKKIVPDFISQNSEYTKLD